MLLCEIGTRSNRFVMCDYYFVAKILENFTITANTYTISQNSDSSLYIIHLQTNQWYEKVLEHECRSILTL